jgi:hypothetical protein
MPATGLFPLRRSRHRPARLSAVPTSMTTALAVLRSRRRELEPSNVADGSGFLWRPVRFSGRDRFAETPFVFGVRCSGDRWHAPSRGTRDHMQSNARPHQPAPARACLSGGESFAAAVSRTRRSGLALPRAPQPGRTVRFFPRPVAAALLGLHPSQVCSRSRVDARGIPRGRIESSKTFRFPRDSFNEHLCSSGPTCSLIESVRAPICFRRGVGRPLEYELI